VEVATSKITGGRTISLLAAVHMGHMLQALMTKKCDGAVQFGANFFPPHLLFIVG
jgi:hypothetical protein